MFEGNGRIASFEYFIVKIKSHPARGCICNSFSDHLLLFLTVVRGSATEIFLELFFHQTFVLTLQYRNVMFAGVFGDRKYIPPAGKGEQVTDTAH